MIHRNKLNCAGLVLPIVLIFLVIMLIVALQGFEALLYDQKMQAAFVWRHREFNIAQPF